VFLLSSISEGIPLTVIEAMAARRPVVSTAVGGLPELIEHGVSGMLAPSGDASSLAASLVQLYQNADLRNQMAEVAAGRAQEKFSLQGMLNSYRDVYYDVLGTNVLRQKSGSSKSSVTNRKQTGAHS
jgi:glycosyltransferase involved in cell wall biosynthesis